MAQQRFIGDVTQGKRRGVWGVQQLYKQLTKADTVQIDVRLFTVTTIKDLIQAYFTDRRQHTQTHTHRKRRNPKCEGFLQPGREGMEVVVFGT